MVPKHVAIFESKVELIIKRNCEIVSLFKCSCSFVRVIDWDINRFEENVAVALFLVET